MQACRCLPNTHGPTTLNHGHGFVADNTVEQLIHAVREAFPPDASDRFRVELLDCLLQFYTSSRICTAGRVRHAVFDLLSLGSHLKT